MKRLFSLILLVFVFVALTLTPPALAGDAAAGKSIFSANCAACHAGGKNVVNAAKTLQKDALEKYGMNSFEQIVAQVTNGKAAMPAFKGRLKPEQIENVAAYVLEQAENGWKK
ncbi:MAG TPA: cytochrome C6 [Cyanothece sp. UBA12306]|nr:cytochrome C6 [Cyanothece sp. UBA12306]